MSKFLSFLKLPVNLKTFRKDFSALQTDPYIKEGYRQKAIVRFLWTESGLVKTPHGPLFQSSAYNPTHGNLKREYPEYHPSEEAIKTVTTFAKESGAKVGDELLVQAQRVICRQDLVGQPSVENWHRDGVKMIGLLCVSRENIKGGVSQFRDDDKQVFHDGILEPGTLAIFEDAKMEHRVTPIEVADGCEAGYRDVLLMAHPANRE